MESLPEPQKSERFGDDDRVCIYFVDKFDKFGSRVMVVSRGSKKKQVWVGEWKMLEGHSDKVRLVDVTVHISVKFNWFPANTEFSISHYFLDWLVFIKQRSASKQFIEAIQKYKMIIEIYFLVIVVYIMILL